MSRLIAYKMHTGGGKREKMIGGVEVVTAPVDAEVVLASEESRARCGRG